MHTNFKFATRACAAKTLFLQECADTALILRNDALASQASGKQELASFEEVNRRAARCAYHTFKHNLQTLLASMCVTAAIAAMLLQMVSKLHSSAANCVNFAIAATHTATATGAQEL